MSYKKLKRKLTAFAAIAVASMVILTGCKGSSSSDSSSETQSSEEESSTSTSDVEGSTIDTSEQFTDRDLDWSYDESEAITVTLADGASEASDSSVVIEGDTITISEEGVYVFSGTLSNGQIQVNNEAKDAKIQIVLNGVEITNESSACIYVVAADKVFVTTAEGTENSLSVTGEYVNIDDNNIDGVIFSKDDLVLNGDGVLNIEGSTGHGVVSKDDLKVTGGTLNINSSDHGLSGKDSVRITGATISITTNEDGIHSSNDDDEDTTAGYIYVADGTITINAGDDGMHADLETRIDGGDITIEKSYEGLEGQIVTVVGGTISVTSDDDGMNAGGGADASGATSGFGGGKDMFSASNSDCKIYIYGGNININASGDGIDSNGDLYIYGGEIYVEGPENSGNAAIDKGDQGTAVISGGTLIATGMSGMAEGFSEDSTQVSVLLNLSTTVSGEVQLLDSEGNVLLSYTPSKSYNSVNISTADLAEGETYTIVTGDTETEITVDSVSVTEGEASMSGNMGGRGGMGGAMQGGRGNFSENGSADGEMTFPQDGEMTAPNGSEMTPPLGEGDQSSDSESEDSTDATEDSATTL